MILRFHPELGAFSTPIEFMSRHRLNIFFWRERLYIDACVCVCVCMFKRLFTAVRCTTLSGSTPLI